MKLYTYGYDIKNEYDDQPRTIAKPKDGYLVVSTKELSDEEVIYRVLYNICHAAWLNHKTSLKQRIEETRALFEINNIKLLRVSGK